MIGDTLRALILGRPGVAAIVGGRVYPNLRPPAISAASIVYTHVSSVPTVVQDGPAGPTRSRYQLNLYADDYARAEQLLRLLVNDLSGYRGTVGGRSIGGVFVENVSDASTLVAEPSTQTQYGKRLDLIVWHD